MNKCQAYLTLATLRLGLANLQLQRYAEEGDGVWRTINGRRVFIGKGESLQDALKRSLVGGQKPVLTRREEKLLKSWGEPYLKRRVEVLSDARSKEVLGFDRELDARTAFNLLHKWGAKDIIVGRDPSDQLSWVVRNKNNRFGKEKLRGPK